MLKERGLAQSKAWRLDEGLRSFHDAAATFKSAGEEESITSVNSQIADVLRMLGEQHESWQFIGRYS